MKKETKPQIFFVLFTFSLLSMPSAYADQTIINNNYGGSAPNSAPAQSSCNNQTAVNQAQSSYGTNTPPGTYTVKRGDGSSETIYTTGDKKPYIIDNGCNSTPIQPYIYAQPPFPGPGPGPGPKPGPR